MVASSVKAAIIIVIVVVVIAVSYYLRFVTPSAPPRNESQMPPTPPQGVSQSSVPSISSVTISVSPSSVSPEGKFTVNGTISLSSAANANTTYVVVVYINGSEASRFTVTIQPGQSRGAFSQTLTAPSSPGNYEVSTMVNGTSSNTAVLTVIMPPVILTSLSISVNNTVAQPGEVIEVAGIIKLSQAPMKPMVYSAQLYVGNESFPLEITANQEEVSFTTSVTAPSSPGSYRVSLVINGMSSNVIILKVVIPSVSSVSISMNPTTPQPGQQFTLSITVNLNMTTELNMRLPGTVYIDGQAVSNFMVNISPGSTMGTLTINLTAPGQVGSHTIYVTVGNTQSNTITFTVSGPTYGYGGGYGY